MSETVQTDPELLTIKRQQLRLKQAKIKALTQDGLPFYKPHPKQDRFHRSVASRRGVFTGNRFGKSTMGCAEDAAWLRGERVWYPVGDVARTSGIPIHTVKGLIIANDWDKVKEIWTGDDGKLWKFLGKPGVSWVKHTSRNHSGAVDLVIVKGKYGLSTLRFDTVQSFKSNPLGSESSDWDFIHIDEPCPEGMFKAQARGCVDRGGFVWFTLTSIAEPWITDLFTPEGIYYAEGYKIEGAMDDNIYLTKKNMDDYCALLNPDELECRRYGIPLHKAGLVYKEFQWDKHVLETLPKGWRSWMEPPKDWSYYYYIDPHPRVPNMVLFVAVDPFGMLYYFYDLFKMGKRREMTDDMHSVLDGRHVIHGRCDPIAFIEDKETGRTWADDFADHGFPVSKAVKDPLHGIARTQEALGANPSAIRFTPACRRSLWEIQRWSWDQETNKPVDKDDHAMECLYRSTLDGPCFVDKTAWPRHIEDIIIDGPRWQDDSAFSMAL
jgi:hypothetical protein